MTEIDLPGLAACPFCGGEAESDSQRYYRNSTTGRPETAAAIYCTKCSAHMTWCYRDTPEVEREQVMVLLTEQWNTRASASAASAPDGVVAWAEFYGGKCVSARPSKTHLHQTPLYAAPQSFTSGHIAGKDPAPSFQAHEVVMPPYRYQEIDNRSYSTNYSEYTPVKPGPSDPSPAPVGDVREAIRAAVMKHCHVNMKWPATAVLDDLHFDEFVADIRAALTAGDKAAAVATSGARVTTVRALVDDPNSASGKSLRDVEALPAASRDRLAREALERIVGDEFSIDLEQGDDDIGLDARRFLATVREIARAALQALGGDQ